MPKITNPGERRFSRCLERDKQQFVHHPPIVTLSDGTRIQPDFLVKKTRIYYEVIGNAASFSHYRKKHKRLRRLIAEKGYRLHFVFPSGFECHFSRGSAISFLMDPGEIEYLTRLKRLYRAESLQEALSIVLANAAMGGYLIWNSPIGESHKNGD